MRTTRDAAAREFYFDRHPGFFLGLLHLPHRHLHVLDEPALRQPGGRLLGPGRSALATCCRAALPGAAGDAAARLGRGQRHAGKQRGPVPR